jgi:NTE family protein
VLETLDEIGAKPVAIAGTSVGALVGAAYAAGMSGRQIRRFAVSLGYDRAEVLRRLVAARAGTFGELFSTGILGATLLNAEKFCAQFLPEDLPKSFAELAIPLTVIASDLHSRQQVAFSAGPLVPALAASIALPTLMRPVVIEGRVLIDGGATNPLPFDQLWERADIVLAVDVSGEANTRRRDVPNPWECILTTVVVMGSAITAEKLKHRAPDLVVRPKVGSFRTIDFLQASAILRASEPIKSELKEKLTALLAAS